MKQPETKDQMEGSNDASKELPKDKEDKMEEAEKGNDEPNNGNVEEKNNAEQVEKPKKLRLLFTGSTNWDMIGRKSLPKAVENRGGTDDGDQYLAPVRMSFENLDDDFTSVYTGPLAVHIVLISDGVAYAMGRNDHGQLAQDDLRARRHPVRLEPPVKDGEKIVQAACGRSHTLLVSDQGRCFSVGTNNVGQLGNGNNRKELKNSWETDWQVVIMPPREKILSCAAGADFSTFCCESGKVFSAGSGQYGQLGNGRTGESIQVRNRVGYESVTVPIRIQFLEDVKIVQVAAGSNHVLALDDKKKVWSWGWGGYGQLGHRKPGDELRPRRIESFDGDHYSLDMVACGASASYAVQRSRKSIYYWGLTKKTGESNMYPKPVFDMQGWIVRSISCGPTSTVTAAEKSVISWGSAPTYGELGYGEDEAKSSTKPKAMSSMEGATVVQVGVGMGFTVMLAEDEGENEKKEDGKAGVLESLQKVVVNGEVGGKRKVQQVKGKKGKKRRR